MMSSEGPARSTARPAPDRPDLDLVGIAENVTFSADPAALFRELLAAAGMTLRNPAGIVLQPSQQGIGHCVEQF